MTSYSIARIRYERDIEAVRGNHSNLVYLSLLSENLSVVNYKMHKKQDNVNKPKKAQSHADARSAAKSQKGSHRGVHRQTKSDTSVNVRKARKRLDSFSHTIYENASKIFQHLKGQITTSQLPVFDDDLERRRAYSLAFGAKRCKLDFS